jgi:hypothetical protein
MTTNSSLTADTYISPDIEWGWALAAGGRLLLLWPCLARDWAMADRRQLSHAMCDVAHRHLSSG